MFYKPDKATRKVSKSILSTASHNLSRYYRGHESLNLGDNYFLNNRDDIYVTFLSLMKEVKDRKRRFKR